ncbi:MAG: hypothetical protein ABFC89_03005 [Methanospirillum sp.]
MGRVFLSPRMGVRGTAERWRRLGRSVRDWDRAALDRLAGMAMAHASEGFFALDDPLEAAAVSVLVELAKGVA